MDNKNILVIPHTPHIHVKVRSLEIAKALAVHNNVYYLLWDEINDFSLLGRLKQRVFNTVSKKHKRSVIHGYEMKRYENVTVLENVPRAYTPVWYAERHNSKQLKDIVDEHEIDIVINASFISSPVRKSDSLTYVYDLVDDPFNSGKDSIDRIRARFIEKEIKKADIVTACSITLAEYASETWNREVLFLPNGTEVSSFEAVSEETINTLKKRWGIKDRKIIGFISNFEPWNGLPFLAEVFKELSQLRNDVVLLLVGTGSGLEQVREKFEQMDNVIMTGAVPPERIAEYFKIIDVGLLPFDKCDFTDRAFPIKIVEYSVGRKHVVAVPLTELQRQKLPNVHLVHKDVGLWVNAIDKALAMDWQEKWDRNISAYDWTRIIDDRLVPAIESVTGLSEEHFTKKISQSNEIYSYFSHV